MSDCHDIFEVNLPCGPGKASNSLILEEEMGEMGKEEKGGSKGLRVHCGCL